MASFTFVAAAFLIVCFYGGHADTLRIKNFSVDRTQSSNDGSMFFVFGTDPYIPFTTASTYEVVLHWTEKFSGYSNSLTISRYSTSCSTNGYFTTDGSTYHFSVSKYSLGSGPLSLYISVSLVCTSRYNYCNYGCSYGSWGYKGTSDTITIDAVRGSYAPFEVDIQLWPGERCHEFAATVPTSNLFSAVLSVIKETCTCSTSNTLSYKSRYLCVHDNFITFRGVLERNNDTMATDLLDTLQVALKLGRSFMIGNRQMTMQVGPCGLSISSIDAPPCDKGNPPSGVGDSSVSIPKTWNGDIVIQGGSGGAASSSAPSGGDASLKTAIVAVSVVCAVAVFAVLGLVVYIGYTKYKKRKQATVGRYNLKHRTDEDSGHLTFAEE